MDSDHQIELVMLAMPNLSANLDALEQLERAGYQRRVTATAQFQDEEEALLAAGADAVFNIYNEAGAGFAEHTMSEVSEHMAPDQPAGTSNS